MLPNVNSHPNVSDFPSNNMHLPAQPMRSSMQIHLVTELGMITYKPKHRLLSPLRVGEASVYILFIKLQLPGGKVPCEDYTWKAVTSLTEQRQK